MKRAQIYLEDEEYEALRTEAFKRRSSISAVLRNLVQVIVIRKPKKRHAAGLDAIVGMVHETQPDVAERHDHYLWGEEG